MLQLTYLFVGLIAAVATFQTIRTADDQVAIISGLIATMAWLLWAYSSLNVIVYDGSSNPIAAAYPSLAAFGVMMAIPNLYIALTGPLRIARDPNDLAQEVN